jgi:hypothetical protein
MMLTSVYGIGPSSLISIAKSIQNLLLSGSFATEDDSTLPSAELTDKCLAFLIHYWLQSTSMSMNSSR